jgi:ABC-type transport system involved in cytochrome c biogenesis permease subunit
MEEKLVIIFFWLAMMAYAAAFVFYLYLFIQKRRVTSILATSFMLLGFALHTASFLARWRSIGHIQIDGAFESYLMIAWAIALIYLILESLTDLKVMGAWVLPFMLTLMGISWFRYESTERLSRVVENSWVIMHVSVIFLSYAGFTMAAAAAALYLIQQRQLKKRRVNLMFRRLPSLEVLDDLSNKAVSLSLPFMTMVIVTGILKAVKQVPEWYLDPIVISTTLTWIVYAAYLGLRYLGSWQGRRVAYVAILGFMSLFLIEVMRTFSFHQFG